MWFVLIGWFIYGAAKMSYQQLVTRRALEGEPLKRFMKTDPVTVPESTTIDRLVEDYVYRYHYKLYPVVNADRLLGCISTRDIKEVPRDEWTRRTVGEVAEKCNPENTISPDADAVEALSVMRRNQASRLLVVDAGELLGIIALKDMLEFLSLKIELDE
jgi:CBS domain-containing protein